MTASCGTCIWFNGDENDGRQFCDELEIYIHSSDCCSRYKEREEE